MCVENGWAYFRNWWKSFTIKEKVLTIVETVLLVGLIALIVIIFLHFLICEAEENNSLTATGKNIHTQSGTKMNKLTEQIDRITKQIVTPRDHIVKPTNDSVSQNYYLVPTISKIAHPTDTNGQWTDQIVTSTDLIVTSTEVQSGTDSTTNKHKVTCTANFNLKTRISVLKKFEITTTKNRVTSDMDIYSEIDYDEDLDITPNDDFYDEVDNVNVFKKYLAAFVAVSNMKLGCPLTVLSKFWTITSASCIKNTKKVDPKDEYVIIEDYSLGETDWMFHTIASIKIHPTFQGFNRSYDVAVLKTDDAMEFDKDDGFVLPIMFDFLILNIGNKLNILGFGNFRNNTRKSSDSNKIIKTKVFVLPRSQCPYSIEENEEIRLRNLKFVPSSDRKYKTFCPETTICAGVLFGRRSPCYFCSGTPLLKGRLLMGIMSDNEECGLTCEPVHYVNIAHIADWLKFAMNM